MKKLRSWFDTISQCFRNYSPRTGVLPFAPMEPEVADRRRRASRGVILLLLISPLFGFTHQQHKLFTLMLNPAGDAKDAGRMLNDSFERGVTLQFCQELKQEIETHYPNVRVVLTRVPGETLEFLQNANFANRLDIDFYLSIHFYKETEVKPKLFLYHYLNDPFIIKIFNSLNFTKYNNAHLINIDKTKKYGNSLKRALEKNTSFSVQDMSGIPFKPLVGIKAPAIAIEAGLKTSMDYKNLVEPVLKAVRSIITSPVRPEGSEFASELEG